jgi:filamentous hemagglutinin
MAQEIINIGTVANDGAGDPLRTAFTKTNNNFSQLFAAGGVSGISNGTSNINILNSGAILMSPQGTANVITVTATGATVTGTLVGNATISSVGNVVAGQFFIGNGSQLTGVVSVAAAALLTGNTLSSNVLNSSLTAVGTLGTLSVAGNVRGGNLITTGAVVASGDVAGSDFNAGSNVNAAGNVTGGNVVVVSDISAGGKVSAVGNVTGNYFIGNGSQLSGIAVSSNAALLVGTTLSSNVIISSLQQLGTLNYLNVSNALGGNGAVNSNSITAGTTINATGNITGGNINTGGIVSAVGNIISGAIISAFGNINTAANIAGGNITAATLIYSAGNIDATGNVNGGNINTAGEVFVTGNITGGNILGGANVNATTHTGTTVSMTGNIRGGNLITAGLANVAGRVEAGNILTYGTVTAIGNITAPNFIGNVVGNITGNLSAPGSNTQVVFNDSGTANAIANLTFNKTTNALTATGTITGGNLSTAGTLSVGGSTIITGNLTVNGTTEYTNVSTLAIQDPIIGIGRGANNAALTSNDSKDRGEQLYYFATTEKSAFIGYQASSGNLIAAANVTITNEVVTVTSYGTLQVGTLAANTAVSAVGNVTSGNSITSGLAQSASLSVTGNTATLTSANYQIGYRDLPQITTFSTLVADAGGKHYYGSGTITIPASGTLNFAVGTAILIIASASTTIANAAGVTLIQAGTGSTGSRTLAQYGEASLVKVATDTWYVSGSGLS